MPPFARHAFAQSGAEAALRAGQCFIDAIDVTDTPPAKRRLGYYALPLLWRDAVVGWANAALVAGALEVETGFIGKRPRDAAFRRELDAEIQRMSAFLGARVGKVIAR